MSLLLALTAGAGVSADLDVTDASDTLAALAGILLEVSLSVTDAADTLAADVSIADTPEEAPVSLGGRNKLFDTPARRVIARLSVTDDDDRLFAVAKVAQLVQAAKGKVVELAKVGAAMSVLDDADTLQSTAKGTWPERHMVTVARKKLISSKYEAIA